MKFNHALLIVVIVFIIISWCGIAYTQSNNIYTTTFKVVEIDKNEDVIYLIDNTGNEWIWEDIEDWQVDDYAAATMNTNGTETIYDDIIVSLKYIGIAAR